MQLIARQELTSAAASITFSSIPQTFTDLYLVLSVRSNRTGFPGAMFINFNSSGFNATGRFLYGEGSGSGQTFSYSDGLIAAINSSIHTANTFSSTSIYIANYTSSANKSFSVDSVFETNATAAEQDLNAGLWSNAAAISSIEIDDFSTNNFVSGSSATLYGILAGSSGGVVVS
jgi:hypothetical protein